MTADFAPKRERSVSPPPLKKRKLDSTTTSESSQCLFLLSKDQNLCIVPWIEKAVSQFFTPVSKKEPEQVTWRIINESLLFASHEPNLDLKNNTPPEKRRRIAAFDLVCMMSLRSQIYRLTIL